MTQILDVSPTADNTTPGSGLVQVQSVAGRMLALACSQDGQTVYTGSFANLWSSQDGGQTWNQLTWPQPAPNQFGVPGALGGWCVMDLAVSPYDPQIVLAIVGNDRISQKEFSLSDKGIWRTADGGITWTQAHQFPAGEAVGQLVWAANTQVVFAAGGSSVAISRDGGVTFQDTLVDKGIYHVAAAGSVPSEPVALVYALGDSQVFVSVDSGNTWTQDLGTLPLRIGGAVGFANSQAPSVMVVSPRSPVEVFLLANANGGMTLGPAAATGPFVSVYNNQQHFAYPDIAGTIWDAYWDGDHNQWKLQQINAGGLTNGPAAAPNGGLAVSAYSNQQHFAYQDSAGTIWDAFWDGDNNQWNLQQINMGGQTSGPPAAPGGGPNISDYGDQQHFAYQDSSGTVWDAFWDGGGNQWRLQQINLGGTHFDVVFPSDITTAPAALSGGTPFVSTYGDQQHFAYQDNAGTIWDAFWNSENSQWTLQQINTGGRTDGLPAAPGGGPFVSVFHRQQHFVYQDTAGTIWDAFWNGRHWAVQQINAGELTDGPAAAAGGSPFVSVYNDQQHFVYQDGTTAGVIWDAFWNGHRWGLQQINLQRNNSDARTDGDAVAMNGGPFVCPYNNQHHFAYLDRNVLGAIWDAYWDGDHNKWTLQQINLGPMLWRGDYTHFAATGQSTWKAVILPNLGAQDNGRVFLATTQPGRGDLLFYGPQRSTIYVGPLYPVSASDWRALDDDSQVHLDLHGVFLSPDFEAGIQNGNYHFQTGTLWLLSDGGVYRSTDGGQHLSPAHNLKTLSCVNVAGAAIEGQGPILSLNSGDNGGFFSPDGGATWISQDYGGGDNDCSFADHLRPHSMLVFTPRWDRHGNLVSAATGNTITVYETSPGHLPNVALGTHDFHTITAPAPNQAGGERWNASSGYFIVGYRPLVLNLADDDPSAPGDYVFIRFKSSTETVLLRTQNILGIHQQSDWLAAETGPNLPPGVRVVQASGGHTGTVFYISDPQTPDLEPSSMVQLWKWTDGMTGWLPLVPGGGATSAFRFFVDPYRPDLLYLLDRLLPHIMRSDDGGATWQVDDNLEKQLTSGYTIPMVRNEVVDSGNTTDVILSDMQFHPSDPLTRFAAGFAGVFQTVDGGQTWVRLLDTQALPGRPVNCYYDWISNPAAPALYVAFAGRSLVRIVLN